MCCVLIISHQNPEELAIVEAEENLPNRVCLARIVRRAARPTRQLLNYRWVLLDQLCLEGLRSTWLDSCGKLIPSEKPRYLERSCPRIKGAESRIITREKTTRRIIFI